MKNCTGIILAGGQSVRMGTDKAFVEYKSKYLIQYAIDLFTPLCDEIIISGSNPRLEMFNLPVVADEFPNCGPLSGIHAACKAAKNDTCIIIPCDVPLVSADFYVNMLKSIRNYEAVTPRLAKGPIEPLISCVKKNIYLKIPQFLAAEKYNTQRFFNTLSILYIEGWPESEFRNFNSESDLL